MKGCFIVHGTGSEWIRPEFAIEQCKIKWGGLNIYVYVLEGKVDNWCHKYTDKLVKDIREVKAIFFLYLVRLNSFAFKRIN